MANSADPDQLASSTDLNLHCFQKQDLSEFSRTRVRFYHLSELVYSKKKEFAPIGSKFFPF